MVMTEHITEIPTLNKQNLQNKSISDPRFKRLNQRISSHLRRHVWNGSLDSQLAQLKTAATETQNKWPQVLL